jgi:Domain of unknown function (DUF1918)
VPANKTTAKNTAAKRAIASKTTAKKTTATKTKAKSTGAKARSEKATTRASDKAQPGDLIIIDSPQVGSPPREGEILKVTVGAFSVSYQVRWGDGRETTISPGGGTARIVRS